MPACGRTILGSFRPKVSKILGFGVHNLSETNIFFEKSLKKSHKKTSPWWPITLKQKKSKNNKSDFHGTQTRKPVKSKDDTNLLWRKNDRFHPLLSNMWLRLWRDMMRHLNLKIEQLKQIIVIIIVVLGTGQWFKLNSYWRHQSQMTIHSISIVLDDHLQEDDDDKFLLWFYMREKLSMVPRFLEMKTPYD